MYSDTQVWNDVQHKNAGPAFTKITGPEEERAEKTYFTILSN